jgi:hypothetical protein
VLASVAGEGAVHVVEDHLLELEASLDCPVLPLHRFAGTVFVEVAASLRPPLCFSRILHLFQG